MEAIDIKMQEAIESIQTHCSRLKNLIKNDPISNKADESWKLTLHANDMLEQKNKETVKVNNQSKKNKNARSVPLRNTNEADKLSQKRTIQIPNIPSHVTSSHDTPTVWVKFSLVNGRYQQTKVGDEHNGDFASFPLSNFKNYFRLVYTLPV